MCATQRPSLRVLLLLHRIFIKAASYFAVYPSRPLGQLAMRERGVLGLCAHYDRKKFASLPGPSHNDAKRDLAHLWLSEISLL